MSADEEAVNVILEARTHYEVLSVEQSVDDDTIKKQYKKVIPCRLFRILLYFLFNNVVNSWL